MKTTQLNKATSFRVKALKLKSFNPIKKGIDKVKQAIDEARQQAYADMGLYA